MRGKGREKKTVGGTGLGFSFLVKIHNKLFLFL